MSNTHRNECRDAIQSMYVDWGRARVSRDVERIQALLAPDFYVLLDGERMSRDWFIHRVTGLDPRGTLVRFDALVLVLDEVGDRATAVISEKLEFETGDADRGAGKHYEFWITRDGCEKVDGRWSVVYSEAIGHESWTRGRKPPMVDW